MTIKNVSVYIAGPMRSVPLFNFPAFDAAQKHLEESFPNWEVISPAQMDRDVEGFDPSTTDPLPVGFVERAMARDKVAISRCKYIVLLPGWKNSSGVREEIAFGIEHGLRFLRYPDLIEIYPGHMMYLELAENLDHTAMMAIGEKPSNPKDAIGVNKTPMSCVPLPVVMEMGLGMLEGACKYGRHNYRTIGVRASIYIDAAFRHLADWWEGEDDDPDSGLSHIAKALSCLAVLRDAQMNSHWTDDRPPKSSAGWLKEMNEKVKAILARYPNPKPAFVEKLSNGMENKPPST